MRGEKVAEQVLRCEKCKRRFRTRSHDPRKSYFCPDCNWPLRPESRPSPDTPAQTVESDGDASRDPLVGRQIGPYRIVSKLGEGGMGAVYKAQHVDLRRFSALKILPEGKSSRAARRFMREARSAAVLSHPNIVTVYTVGEAEGHRFIDMEFVEGESVQDRLQREGRFSVEEATRIIRDAATALAEAHAANIVHRDIKPGNILLSKKGTVKVADFGLAKDVQQDSLVTQEGKGGLGTPSFMSPEQCDGLDLDGRADIYSLGVTYFHLLTGDLPFKATSILTVMLKHKTEPPPDPRKYVPALPEAACAIIEKCLAKDPNERYQRCEVLLADLDRVPVDTAEPAPPQESPVAGPSTDISQARAEAHTVTGPTPPGAGSRRGRLVVGAVGLAIVGIVVVIGYVCTRPGRLDQTVEEITKYAEDTKGEAGVRQETEDQRPEAVESRALAPEPSKTKLPLGFGAAFMLPDTDKDQHGNPVVARNGSRFDPETGWAYEVWLKEPRMEFVLIPAGEFLMGAPEEDIQRLNEKYKKLFEKRPDHFTWQGPQHRVRITKAFYLAKYETTVAQFRWFVEKTGYRTEAEKADGADAPVAHGRQRKPDANWQNPHFEQGDAHPVVWVNWHDAMAFCEGLSEAHGSAFGLPTEAQWEYACRAGSGGQYCYGDDPEAKQLGDYAWYNANAGGKTHGVGEKKPNAWGLYDMHGNAREWCVDGYRRYSTSLQTDPCGPEGGKRVLGGGSLYGNPYALRSANRDAGRPTFADQSCGFRVVVPTQDAWRARTTKQTQPLSTPRPDAGRARRGWQDSAVGGRCSREFRSSGDTTLISD